MLPVSVLIFHKATREADGPFVRLLSEARRRLAERHRRGFLAAGAGDAAVVAGTADDTPFGRRLAAVIRSQRTERAVILGSGAIPLASLADRRLLLDAARAPGRRALANNRFSADAIAISSAGALADLPDLPGDNALPRWLAERAGFALGDLRARWRWQVDLDGPLDLILLAGHPACPPELRALVGSGPSDARWADLVRDRLEALRAVTQDPRAELLIAGRTSSGAIAWLERATRCRVRALIEERGLRASTTLAQGTPLARPRPVRSVLGALLDRDGPEAFGARLAELSDGALVDTRVLLAHRLGVDERGWPSPEDRFASDLLLAERVADPWLRALTASAVAASIPVLLGGHSLVGPGVRLIGRGA